MMIYSILRTLAFILLKILFRLEVVGIDFIPKQGAFIIASNHLSNIDPVILGAVSPRKLNFLAKEELFRVICLSWLLPRIGVLPLKRGRPDIFALKTGLRRLKQKSPLVVFPEGTRRIEEKKIRAGVGFLVLKSQAPVVPARIYNSDRVLAPGQVIPNLKRIKVVFGKPIIFDNHKSPETIAREVLERINSL